MTLGNKIQELRMSRGMSQEQFGEMFDTTRQTVSKWELDQAIPDIRKIVAISRVFCVPTDDLLLNVSTFENDGVPFSCGIYRSGSFEIVETEKLALEYYSKGKHAMGAKAYYGNGDSKELIAICEQDFEKNTVLYAFGYDDEDGTMKKAGNSGDFMALLGTKQDRSKLEKAECLESFLVNHGEYPLHTVKETGIRKCLEEWRLGSTVFAMKDCFLISLFTKKAEYIFMIKPKNTNIYCGCSYNIPFDLGIRSYGQYFRLRNFDGSTEGWNNSFFNFDYSMPSEIEGIDCTKFAGETQNACGLHTWFVKRYKDDEIVLAGCGDDEYIYRKNEGKFERYSCR